eukprot:scaffold5360_cov213-Amphora_coffeaeformis.AAC.3
MRGFQHNKKKTNSPPVRGLRGGFLTTTTDDSSANAKREFLCGGVSLPVSPTVEGQFDDSDHEDDDDNNNNNMMEMDEAGDSVVAPLVHATTTTTMGTSVGSRVDTPPTWYPHHGGTTTTTSIWQEEPQPHYPYDLQGGNNNEPAGLQRQNFLPRTQVNPNENATIVSHMHSTRSGVSIRSHASTSTNSSFPSGHSSSSSSWSSGGGRRIGGGQQSRILPPQSVPPPPPPPPAGIQHPHHHHNDSPFAGYDIPEDHSIQPPLHVPATVERPPPTVPAQHNDNLASHSSSSNVTVASNMSSISGHSQQHPDHHQPTQQQPNHQQQSPPPPPQTSPRLPQYKLTGAPKSELYAIYGKDPYRKILSPADYITWNDGGPPHDLRFTSAFVCPVTGETFAAAGYQVEGTHYEWKSDGLCWYKSKKMAEHGAAARAHDCLSYRAVPVGQAYPYVGNDAPYHKQDRPDVSSLRIPPPQLQQIVAAQIRAPQFDSDEELERDLFT